MQAPERLLRNTKTNLEVKGGKCGIALGIVIVTAAIFAVAAFGVLTMAGNYRQQSAFLSDRALRARYAAEAGLVYGMQQLWVDANYPNSCCGGGCAGSTKTQNWTFDATTNVDISVTNCGAGREHQIKAKVTF